MNNIIHVDLNNISGDRLAVTQCAKYVRNRLTDTNIAEAWISIGQHLGRLKEKLIKTSPRGSNERIGWKQAFALEPKEFPFSRRYADKLILVGEFFSGHTMTTKNLPASIGALIFLAENFPQERLGESIAAGEISAWSTEAEVRALERRFIPHTKKKKVTRASPIKDRVSFVRALMLKLDVKIEDVSK